MAYIIGINVARALVVIIFQFLNILLSEATEPVHPRKVPIENGKTPNDTKKSVYFAIESAQYII